MQLILTSKLGTLAWVSDGGEGDEGPESFPFDVTTDDIIGVAESDEMFKSNGGEAASITTS